MGIRDFLHSIRNKRLKYKEYAEEMKIQEDYIEKKKSANERELERFMREEREKRIKNDLDRYRKERTNEINYGHQILRTKNMFKGGHSDLMQNKKMSHKYHMHEKQGLFFKW